jgi:hypothetical protein
MALTVTRPVGSEPGGFCPILPSVSRQKARNIIPDHALLLTAGVEAIVAFTHLRNEAPMATRQHDQIIETPTEARQAELGPSVLALLTASTGLAVLILGIIWFAFFRS